MVTIAEIGRRNIESTTYGYDVNIAWQADLFGRLKRTQQSQWALLLAEEANQEAVVHAVVASVVRARVLVATADWALDINREITRSWEATTRTVDRRYRAGVAGAVELHLARENLASARASEAVIEGALEQARLALDFHRSVGADRYVDAEERLLDGTAADETRAASG